MITSIHGATRNAIRGFIQPNICRSPHHEIHPYPHLGLRGAVAGGADGGNLYLGAARGGRCRLASSSVAGLHRHASGHFG